MARRVKNWPAMWRPGFDPWVRKNSWRRAWQPTPVFLLENPHGQRSLVGYNPWGHKESNRTERLSTATKQQKLYKTTGLRCSKGVRLIKVKERLLNSHRLKEIKDMKTRYRKGF